MDRVPRRPTPRRPAPRSPDGAWDDAETRAVRRDDAPAPWDDARTRAIPRDDAREPRDDAETRAVPQDDTPHGWRHEAETRAVPRRDVARAAWEDADETQVSAGGAWPVDAATRIARGPVAPASGPRRPRPAAEARPRPGADQDPPARGPRSVRRAAPGASPSLSDATRDVPARGRRTPRSPVPPPTDAERGTSRDGWPGRGTTRPLDDRPRRRRPVPIVLVLLLAAIGAGLLGWMGQTATEGTVRGSWEFSRLGGPWLVAGFAGGAIGGWRRGPGGLVLGVVAGAVIVGAGSVAYYGLSYWDGGNDARRAAKLGIGWGAAGVAVGGTLGLVGASYATALGRHLRMRDGRRVGSWVHGAALGTLGGLVMGESIALLWVWEDGGLRAMAALEGLGGAAIVVLGAATRSWRFIVAAVVAAALSATVAPIATTMLRETLRTIGWAGA